MKFTSHSYNKKTRILESRIGKGDMEFFRSNVSKVRSEQLLPMLNGLLTSLGFKEDEYDLHLIPMELCQTGLSLTLVFNRKYIDRLCNNHHRYGKLISVIGCPQDIVEVRLNTYALCWTRNIVQWF